MTLLVTQLVKGLLVGALLPLSGIATGLAPVSLVPFGPARRGSLSQRVAIRTCAAALCGLNLLQTTLGLLAL